MHPGRRDGSRISRNRSQLSVLGELLDGREDSPSAFVPLGQLTVALQRVVTTRDRSVPPARVCSPRAQAGAEMLSCSQHLLSLSSCKYLSMGLLEYTVRDLGVCAGSWCTSRRVLVPLDAKKNK